jgi:hypothetical protein
MIKKIEEVLHHLEAAMVLEGEEEEDIIEEKNMGIKLSKLLIKLIKT